jgi:hypothetical protein
VILLALLAEGCGWQRTMTFRSPSRKAAIEVWQKGIDNSWGARVELVTNRGRTVLYQVRADSFINFFHVYWSPDETNAGILATGAKIFSLACNTKTGALIPFDGIREDFGKSIRAAYHVPPGEDPIQWAAMADAQVEFFKLHPEIRLSYH